MANNMTNSSFLWFEFLINRDLLEQHLEQADPEPSPSVLLQQFVENTEKYSISIAKFSSSNTVIDLDDPVTNLEHLARVTKVQTFKSMALQMAAYLNWDLDILALLPFGVQHSLINYAYEYIELNQFICSVYHRWVLRSCQTPLRKATQQDPLLETISKSLTQDTSFRKLTELLEGAAADSDQAVIVPTPVTFSTNNPDFTQGTEIPMNTFRSILHLDIGIYLLYKSNSPGAADHFQKSDLPENYVYLKMTKDKLEGYFKAVGVLPTDPDSPEDRSELKAVEFARLLRTGAIGKIKKMVGGSTWNGPSSSLRGRDTLSLDQRDKQRDGDSIFELEKRLLETHNMVLIKDILVKLHAMTSTPLPGPSGGIAGTRTFYKLFSNVEIPIPIQHSLNKFPPGAFQDYLFIVVAKSKQYQNMKHFKESRAALQTARNDLNEQILAVPPASTKAPYFYNVSKLIKILDWELTLIDLSELFDKWPSMTTATTQKKFLTDIRQKCKEVVHTSFHLNKTNDVIPRSEILETIVMALLNLGEYSFIIEQGLTKWPFLEFLTLIAKVCTDLVERKDSSSNYRELWYAVLPSFSMNSGKRQQAIKNAGLVSNRSVFLWVIERSHSQLLVSLFVSLLARFHNHIQDDVTLQIHSADFLHIWPNILDDVTTSSEIKSRVSGSSKLNAGQIFDVLLSLLNRSQHNEPMWLKCIGDVYLASSNPAQAMKSYLEYLALATDFFEKHSSTHWSDNSLFRRMIKCCEIMQSFTQAVILCQFLTEVDYSLAFGMAQEKMTSDATDALYGFIWDLAILEFLVNLHTKRNELGKRQQAVKVMGLLELNASNNEEIQREAMHLRKFQFMRTLSKLYIFV